MPLLGGGVVGHNRVIGILSTPNKLLLLVYEGGGGYLGDTDEIERRKKPVKFVDNHGNRRV